MKDIIFIVGASGSGKSFLEKELVKKGYNKLVSYTTRTMRDGEVDGKDYYFITKEQFHEYHLDGLLAETVSFHGNYYALSIAELEKKNGIAVVEPHGLEILLSFVGNKNYQIIYLDIAWYKRIYNMIFRRKDGIIKSLKRFYADDIPKQFKKLGLQSYTNVTNIQEFLKEYK